MSHDKIVPCLWFDRNAEEAARFYTETFPDGRVRAVTHYPASGENPGGMPPGSVLTVEFEIAGQAFTALNGGPAFQPNHSISFFVRLGSPAEVDRLYGILIEGGSSLMPLDRYDWSERYAWVRDRFGISWQLMAAAPAEGPIIVPCLMFAGAQQGRAEEAIRHYTEIFPGAEVKLLERYRGGGGPEGQLMYGGFVLDGQELSAMDSGVEQGLAFNEGVSLQVMCRDQAEIDRYWEKLSEGGEKGVCGWLKDRFGVSWQVVPEQIREWFEHPDPAARERAFRVMMTMKKFEIAAFEEALRGG